MMDAELTGRTARNNVAMMAIAKIGIDTNRNISA